ncbi:PREDICTED: uncharacterized protein LOC109335434 [Lupinus angustifolius]|uniref:uncharacterized protein LOC109335434 n=1 Tax=Lupinus angustifolius TaxID=3871 RepID=UPI00092E79C8|nr:PREDICTED: uncharacterized protein LOC109335434 [Lupinus angustifolius]
MVKRSYKFPIARSDKPMSLSLSSSFVSRGHDCLSKPNPDSKSTPQLEQNVEPKSTQLGLNDEREFSSSVAGATTEVMKTSKSRSLKVFGEGEGVSSTLRLENGKRVSSTLRLKNGKRVRHPPAKYESFLSVDLIFDNHKQKPRRPSNAHLKHIVVPFATRSNDGGVPPPADAHELAQFPSNSVPIGSPKPGGRPKKNVVASPSIVSGSAAYGGAKKPAVARKPMKKSIGKPMGRPKGILSYFF